MGETVRHHADPRMSANELARFMVSSDVSRLSIIRNAREAKAAIVIRYKDAREPITKFLTAQYRDLKLLHAAEEKLKQKAKDPAVKAFMQQDAALSAEAVAAVANMANTLGPIDFQPAPVRQTNLVISGVSVSVNLDALVHAATQKKQLIGGALLRLTKADENETEASASKRQTIGGYAATLVYLRVLDQFKNNKDREPSPAHCYSIDVQYGDIHAASASLSRRMENLKAACQTIAAMWNTA